MPSYKEIKKETVLEAIKNSQGIISTIAKRLGNCDAKTVKRLIKRWKETDDAYNNEVDFVLDLAESKVIKAINDGDIKTAKWYLELKGRERGYERTTVFKQENTNPLNINLSGAGDVSREDLLQASNVEIGGEGGDEA